MTFTFFSVYFFQLSCCLFLSHLIKCVFVNLAAGVHLRQLLIPTRTSLLKILDLNLPVARL